MYNIYMNIHQIKQVTDPVFKKHKITKASLFGSAARGEMKSGSDIDFLINPAQGTTLFDMAGIKVDLESSLGRPVDIVTYGGISPFLREQILNNQKVIYEKR